MSKLVIFGAGSLAEVAHYYFSHDTLHQVVAFAVDGKYLKSSTLLGCPVVAFEEMKEKFPPDRYAMFVALSYAQLNKLREQKYAQAKQAGYTLLSYVSSKASVCEGVLTGDNCFVLENNVLQPYVRIGRNVTLWSGNHVGHHSVIEDHVFVSSQVVISGNVHIGAYSFLGVNATVGDGVSLSAETVVGAGALVLENTAPGSVYSGIASHARRVSPKRLKMFFPKR